MRIGFAGTLASSGTQIFMRAVASGFSKIGHEVFFFLDASQEANKGVNGARSSLVQSGVVIVEYSPSNRIWWTEPGIGLRGHVMQKKLDFMFLATDGNATSSVVGRWGTRLIVTVHYVGGFFVPCEASSVWHLSHWSRDAWQKAGGRHKDVRVVSHPLQPLLPSNRGKNLTTQLGLAGKFVFGMHQRVDDGIFSDVPLKAYKNVETDGTAFLVIGGSPLYSLQAEDLRLKTFIQIPAVSRRDELADYLSIINVYCHGRRDGEVNSVALAEAMSLGLPILSHNIGTDHLGHLEQVSEIGFVSATEFEYSEKMVLLMDSPKLRTDLGRSSKAQFKDRYGSESVILSMDSILRDLHPHTAADSYLKSLVRGWLQVPAYHLSRGLQKLLNRQT